MQRLGKSVLLVGLGLVGLAYAAKDKVGELVIPFDSSKRAVRQALRRWAGIFGLEPDWVDAIAKVESEYVLDSFNGSGNDALRGGAHGPTQITEKTARAHGYTGDMIEFRRDPELAAQWTCLIIAASTPRDFSEIVAVWNAGRYDSDKNDNDWLDAGEAPASTVETYWPRAQRALTYVKENPV
jgi:soluble lytic murein transglycosylase-like protein